MITLVFIAIGIIAACIALLIGEIRRYLARPRSKQQEFTPKHSVASPTVSWSSIAWAISLALLCLGIVAHSLYFPQATWVHLPYHIGRKFGDGIVMWLIFNVTVGRKQGYMRAAFAFLLISGTTITTGLISHAEGQRAAKQMKTELRRFFVDPTNADQSLPYAERQRGAAAATEAEFSQVTQFIKTFMDKMATLQMTTYAKWLQVVSKIFWIPKG